MASVRAIEVTDENFEEKVLKSELPVLVHFWAEWAAPCKTLRYSLSSVAEEMDGKFVLAEVDMELNQEIPYKCGVKNVPACHLYKNGRW